MTGDGHKEHKRLKWAVLPRCLVKGELQRKGPSSIPATVPFVTYSWWVMTSLFYLLNWHSLNSNWRLNGFNFTISCDISKQKHNSLYREFLWGSVSLIFFPLKEAGALYAGYARWKAARWRPWVLPNSRYSDRLQRSRAGAINGKQEVFEIYLSSEQASQESLWLHKTILTN